MKKSLFVGATLLLSIVGSVIIAAMLFPANCLEMKLDQTTKMFCLNSASSEIAGLERLEKYVRFLEGESQVTLKTIFLRTISERESELNKLKVKLFLPDEKMRKFLFQSYSFCKGTVGIEDAAQKLFLKNLEGLSTFENMLLASLFFYPHGANIIDGRLTLDSLLKARVSLWLQKAYSKGLTTATENFTALRVLDTVAQSEDRSVIARPQVLESPVSENDPRPN